MFRSLMAIILSVVLLAPAFAQTSESGGSGGLSGGAPPASITQRQNALQEGGASVASDLDYSAAGIARQLGAGAGSDEVFRALRYGTPQVYVSDKDPEARVLIQTGGMRWLAVREGPLLTYGGGFLLAVIAVIFVFFLLRGRVKIGHGRSGHTMLRFTFIERFAHWLLAGSFIILAISGLFLLFGREYLIETMGHEAYATGAAAAKWAHNNVSWAFMLALIMIFVFWVWNNIPGRGDWTWIKQGGGLLSKDLHPPAKKFNFGQKMIFWTTIIFGVSISLTGLSLLFPFEMPMFAKTFQVIESSGVPGWFGYTLPTTLAPHEEMQYAQLWHSIMSFVMIAIIIAHIYIGSIGMQGAFSAMGSGHVDVNWAREHHSIWAAKKEAKGAVDGPPRGHAAPAE